MTTHEALTVTDCLALTDEQAERKLAAIRWGDGPIQCISCGHDRLYRITTRCKFSCMKCGRQFSTTSGTVFHGTKLSLQQCIAGLVSYINHGHDITPATLGAEIGVTTTAARILRMKLFEAVAEGTLEGRSILAVGYFQGFNRIERRGGELVIVRPRDGAVRPLAEKAETQGDG